MDDVDEDGDDVDRGGELDGDEQEDEVQVDDKDVAGVKLDEAERRTLIIGFQARRRSASASITNGVRLRRQSYKGKGGKRDISRRLRDTTRRLNSVTENE